MSCLSPSTLKWPITQQSIPSFNQAAGTYLPAAELPQTPEPVKMNVATYNLVLFLSPLSGETKGNEVDDIFGQILLYAMSQKTLQILILALALCAFRHILLYSAKLRASPLNISYIFPPSLAASQISISDRFSSLQWHLYILLFCSLQVSMTFLFLRLYILQLSLTWSWT